MCNIIYRAGEINACMGIEMGSCCVYLSSALLDRFINWVVYFSRNESCVTVIYMC